MLKTFSLVAKKEEQISSTQGKMVFHLKDEEGFERTVTGLTELDDDLNAFAISALRSREHPLIQCLFLTNVDEEINIDFTQYNDVLKRKDGQVKITSQEDFDKIAREMQDKPMRVGALLKSTQVKSTESMS